MDQEDYLVREISKIGLLLRAIAGSLLNKRENLAISVDVSFNATKELLLNEIHLDIEKLKVLDEGAMYEYLLQFNGLNTVNLELLADVLYQLGKNEQPENTRIFLEKALMIYEMCSNADETFSIIRENKIHQIKNEIQP